MFGRFGLASVFVILSAALIGHAATIRSDAGLTVTVEDSGEYSVHSKAPDWTFGGTVSSKLQNIHTADQPLPNGRLSHLIQGDVAGSGVTISIRLFDDQPTALFS